MLIPNLDLFEPSFYFGYLVFSAYLVEIQDILLNLPLYEVNLLLVILFGSRLKFYFRHFFLVHVIYFGVELFNGMSHKFLFNFFPPDFILLVLAKVISYPLMNHLELFCFYAQVLQMENFYKESSLEDAENLSFLTDLSGMTISEHHLILGMIILSDGLARSKQLNLQIFIHHSDGVRLLLYQVHDLVVDLQVI